MTRPLRRGTAAVIPDVAFEAAFTSCGPEFVPVELPTKAPTAYRVPALIVYVAGYPPVVSNVSELAPVVVKRLGVFAVRATSVIVVPLIVYNAMRLYTVPLASVPATEQ